MAYNAVIYSLFLYLLVNILCAEEKADSAADKEFVTKLIDALKDPGKRALPDWWGRGDWVDMGYPAWGRWWGHDSDDSDESIYKREGDEAPDEDHSSHDDASPKKYDSDTESTRGHSDVAKILTRMLIAKRIKAGFIAAPDDRTSGDHTDGKDDKSHSDETAGNNDKRTHDEMAGLLKRLLKDDMPSDKTDDKDEEKLVQDDTLNDNTDDKDGKIDDKTNDHDQLTSGTASSNKRTHSALTALLKRVLKDDTPDDKTDDKNDKADEKSNDSDQITSGTAISIKRTHSELATLLKRMLEDYKPYDKTDDKSDKADDKTNDNDQINSGAATSNKRTHSALAALLKRVLKDDTLNDEANEKEDKTDEQSNDDDRIISGSTTTNKRNYNDNAVTELLKHVLMTARQIPAVSDAKSADQTPHDKTDENEDKTDNDHPKPVKTTSKKIETELVQLLKRDKYDDKDTSDDGSDKENLLVTVLQRLLEPDREVASGQAAKGVATRDDRTQQDRSSGDRTPAADETVNAFVRDFEDELDMLDEEREQRSLLSKLTGKKKKGSADHQYISGSCKRKGQSCSRKKKNCCYPYYCKKSLIFFGKCAEKPSMASSLQKLALKKILSG